MRKFKNKKLMCSRCGKRHNDADLFMINYVPVCRACMDVNESIRFIVQYCNRIRSIASGLTSDGIYLSDYNPAGNSVMVLEGIDEIISAFDAESEIKPELYKAFNYGDCKFMQVYKGGKL